jgi:hypothetical protein
MRRWGALWVLAWVLAAPPARAYFESSAVGVRAFALGGNFVSAADDASALYWNPAGLTRLPRHEALFTLEYSPEIEGLRRNFAAVVLHTRFASVGAGWNAVRLEDALQEDLFYLSVSRTVVQRSLGAFVAAGANLKLAHVGIEPAQLAGVPALRSDESHPTGDVGVLLSPIPNVTAGAIYRNIGRPQFDLVEGGGKTTLDDEFEWGLSFRWTQEARLHYSRVQRAGSKADNKLGAELAVGDLLDLGIGVSPDQITGGIGLCWRTWRFESAFAAHTELGLVTRVGVRRGFGAERPVGMNGF